MFQKHDTTQCFCEPSIADLSSTTLFINFGVIRNPELSINIQRITAECEHSKTLTAFMLTSIGYTSPTCSFSNFP